MFDTQVALLRDRGHDVRTIELDNDAIPEDGSLRTKIGLAVDTVWSRTGVRRITDAVQQFRPDVLHAHNTFPLLSPAIHGAARAMGVATVQTLHNFRLICPSAVVFRDGGPCLDCVGRRIAWPGVVHACYRDSRAASAAVATMSAVHRLRGTWTRDVDRFIALGPFARDLLVRGGLPPDRISVDPNVIDRPVPPVDGPGHDFLFVGRLTVDKGVETLIAAWERVPQGIELSIAGTGPLEPVVHAAAARDPRIHYLGRLDRADIDARLASARALIVPSLWYEVCPLTVLEAYAAGRPVIGSGHGGLADLIDDGSTGRHFRPGDADHLAQVVTEAHADPAGMLAAGHAGRARYLADHTPERGYARLVAIYEQAIAARAAGGSQA